MPAVPSPRVRFLKQESLVTAHLAVVGSASFHIACDIALQQYMHFTPTTTDPQESAAIAQRITGAKEFIAILFSLADEIPKPPDRAPVGKLNPNA